MAANNAGRISTHVDAVPSDFKLHPVATTLGYLVGWYLLRWTSGYFQTDNATSAWSPEVGLNMALLILGGLRYAPLLLLTHPIYEGFAIRNLPFDWLILFSLGNMSYIVPAAVLRHRRRFDPQLRTSGDVAWLVVIAVICGPLLTAAITKAVLVFAGNIQASAWSLRTLDDWAGDATGVAMITPALLLLSRVPRAQWHLGDLWSRATQWGTRTRLLLLGFESVVVVVGSWAAYGAPRGQDLDYTYFIFVPIVWIAARYGLVGGVTVVVAVNILVTVFVVGQRDIDNALALQFGLMVSSIVGLLLGAFVMMLRQQSVALSASEQQYRTLVEALPDTFFQVRRDGTYLAYTTADEGVLFVPAAQLLGRTIRDILPSAVADQVMVALDQTFATGEVQQIEYQLPQNGMVRWYEARIFATIGDRALAIIRDITEQRLSATYMQQTNQLEAVGRLAAGVAHDFNNLLTAIVGYAELALVLLPPGAEGSREIEAVCTTADRATALTRQLLLFARRQSTEPSVVQPSAMLQTMEDLLQRLVREDIVLQHRVTPDLPAIFVDVNQIEQVLVNLVVNARDAMPTGGTITVAAASIVVAGGSTETLATLEPGNYVVITVRDTGMGMDATMLTRVFEPFFTTKAAEQGTGLGLATAYGIIARHHGHIAIASAVGAGTTVSIYLPLALPTDRPQTGRAGADRTLAVEGTETILLVEDDATIRELVAQALTHYRYTLVTAADGAAAVRAFDDHTGAPIALLLTDVGMPKLSGPDVAAQLRARQSDLQVLLMSGYGDEVLQTVGDPNQQLPLIRKPFRINDLLRAIREQLDQQTGQSNQHTDR